jgi:glycosyltransferase involved in cell wall biosynthesis
VAMKVLMASLDFPPCARGGEGLMAIQVARGLAELGIDLEVIAPATPECSAFDANEAFSVHRVKVLGSTFLTRVPSFYIAAAAKIKSSKVDLIYSLRPVPVRRDIPHVHHFHTLRRGEAIGCWRSGAYLSAVLNFLYAPWDSHMARSAEQIVALTERMAASVANFSHLEDKCVVVGNGIDPERFPANQHRQYKTQKLLYVGRLDARKGILDLIEAFATLSIKYPELSLTVVGDGPLAAKVKHSLVDLGIAHRVSLMPKVDQAELSSIYHHHDILVVPSLYEAFGLVTLEGMSAGIPVLSSDQCADVGQIMYPTGDIAELKSKIDQLLSDSKNRHTLSSAGIEKAAPETSERMLLKLYQLFDKLTSQHNETSRCRD